MTKTIALSLVLAASLGLAACSKEAENTANASENMAENAMNAADNAMNMAMNASENAANAVENAAGNAACKSGTMGCCKHGNTHCTAPLIKASGATARSHSHTT